MVGDFSPSLLPPPPPHAVINAHETKEMVIGVRRKLRYCISALARKVKSSRTIHVVLA